MQTSIPLTLDLAKQLHPGQVVHQGSLSYHKKWRINGAVKLWKRTPSRIQVPIKHGLYEYSYITELNMKEFFFINEVSDESK